MEKAKQQVRIYTPDYERFRKHSYELKKTYPELITFLVDFYEQHKQA